MKINRQFVEADIHVITGLVEPHLLAGVSGGRKAVCPGLINLQATYLFHGVEFMDNPNVANLVLKNNPCHEFALKVAHKTRVDFSLNVTINGSEKLTGVFVGDLEKAHLEAVKKLREYAVVPCQHGYDIILTPGGKVAVNHYQAAKSVYGTISAIKKEGIVILAAHNADEEPIGKDEYKKVLRVLQEKEPGKFTQFIKGKSWQFIPDQWQAQMNNQKIQGLFNKWWPFAKPDKIANEYHYELNGFLNSWYVDTENLCKSNSACTKNADGSYDIEMVIEFWPQRWFYLGLIISGTTLFGCLWYLGYDWRKRRKIRKSKDIKKICQKK